MTKVAVCIPAYQSSAFLAETLQSLSDQTFEDWECHLVDDASTDETVEIAMRFRERDPRFRVRVNENRLGAANNWNESIRGIDSKYLKLLCSDDRLVPNALAAAVTALETNSDAVYAAGRRDVIDESGRVLWRNRGLWRSPVKQSGAQAMARFVRSGTNFFGEPSFGLYRTAVLQEVGGFDSSWSYLIDVASYRDVLQRGSFVPLDETVGAFRVRGGSWSASLVGAQAKETQAMVREVGQLAWVNSSAGDIRRGQMQAGINALARRPFFWIAESLART